MKRGICILFLAACAAEGATPQETRSLEHQLTTPITPFAVSIHPATGAVADGADSFFNGIGWVIGQAEVRFPVPAQVGDSMHAWRVALIRPTAGLETRARLQRLDESTGTYSDVSPEIVDSTSEPGPFVLGTKHVAVPVEVGSSLSIRVVGATMGDVVMGAEAFGSRSSPTIRITLAVHAAAATSRTDGVPAPTFDGASWLLGTTPRPVRYPLPAIVGDVIEGFSVFVHKNGAGTVRASLQRHHGPDGFHEIVGTVAENSDLAPGIISLSSRGFSEPVAAGTAYSIELVGSGVVGDRGLNAEVYVARALGL